MKSKGIAIQTILLLLVGILVVGILVYMVYMYTTGSSLSLDKCRADIIQFCTICSNSGWSTAVTVPAELKDTSTGCAKFADFSFWSGYNNCADAKSGCGQVGVK